MRCRRNRLRWRYRPALGCLGSCGVLLIGGLGVLRLRECHHQAVPSTPGFQPQNTPFPMGKHPDLMGRARAQPGCLVYLVGLVCLDILFIEPKKPDKPNIQERRRPRRRTGTVRKRSQSSFTRGSQYGGSGSVGCQDSNAVRAIPLCRMIERSVPMASSG